MPFCNAPDYGWSAVCPHARLIVVPGDHHSGIAQGQHLRVIGTEIGRLLDELDPFPVTAPLSIP